jgi:hypothetical protein
MTLRGRSRSGSRSGGALFIRGSIAVSSKSDSVIVRIPISTSDLGLRTPDFLFAVLRRSARCNLRAGSSEYQKIWQIAEARGCSYDELISTRLGHEFTELQQFLSSPGVRDFPFDLGEGRGLPVGAVARTSRPGVVRRVGRLPARRVRLCRRRGRAGCQAGVGPVSRGASRLPAAAAAEPGADPVAEGVRGRASSACAPMAPPSTIAAGGSRPGCSSRPRRGRAAVSPGA